MKLIEKIKRLQKTGKNLIDRDRTGSPLKIVFEEPFCLDKVIIDKKDIIKYINGKSTPLLGDDFYYCYTYDGAVLSFVSFRSGSYQSGAAHLLVKALLNEGRYCAQSPSGAFFYYIDNDRQGISVEVDYEKRDGYEVLDAQLARRDIRDSLKDCSTIRAMWSLEKSAFSANILLVAVFAAILISALVISFKQKSATVLLDAQRASQAGSKAPSRGNPKLPNTAATLSKVGAEVSGKGIIETAEVSGTSMKFVISFRTEQAAQSFIRQFGGSYEQGKVIYSTPISGSK